MIIKIKRWSIIIEKQTSSSTTGSGALRGAVELTAAFTRHWILHHLRRIIDYSGLSGNFHVDPVQSAAIHHQATGNTSINNSIEMIWVGLKCCSALSITRLRWLFTPVRFWCWVSSLGFSGVPSSTLHENFHLFRISIKKIDWGWFQRAALNRTNPIFINIGGPMADAGDVE